MIKYKTLIRVTFSSIFALLISAAPSASADTVQRACPFSCRTLGLTNDPSCHDFRRGNQCFVTTDEDINTSGNGNGNSGSGGGTSSTAGLKLCLRTDGSVTARGRCRATDTVLNQDSLAQISDIRLAGVPSGASISGVIGATNQAPFSSAAFSSTTSLDAKLSAALGNESIIVASTTALTSGCGGSATNCLASDESSTNSVCTGSALTPSAPAGKLCIYPTDIVNATAIQALAVQGTGDTAGFRLNWTAPSLGTSAVIGVWIYTAP